MPLLVSSRGPLFHMKPIVTVRENKFSEYRDITLNQWIVSLELKIAEQRKIDIFKLQRIRSTAGRNRRIDS